MPFCERTWFGPTLLSDMAPKMGRFACQYKLSRIFSAAVVSFLIIHVFFIQLLYTRDPTDVSEHIIPFKRYLFAALKALTVWMLFSSHRDLKLLLIQVELSRHKKHRFSRLSATNFFNIYPIANWKEEKAFRQISWIRGSSADPYFEANNICTLKLVTLLLPVQRLHMKKRETKLKGNKNSSSCALGRRQGWRSVSSFFHPVVQRALAARQLLSRTIKKMLNLTI